MFKTFEAKPANKTLPKHKKILKILRKGVIQVWDYSKKSVVKYFDDMMKQEYVIVRNGIIWKPGCGPKRRANW